MTDKSGVCAVCVLALLITACSYSRAQDAKSIEADLRQSYAQKLLSLRNPHFGKTLKFDSTGSLMNDATAGPWSTCGMFRVHRVKVGRQDVEIDGKRVILALRSDEKDQSASPKQVHVIPLLTNDDLRVHIRIPAVDKIQIDRALAQIFQGGQLLERVSSYWKPIASDLADPILNGSKGVFGALEGNRLVYVVKPGVAEPPKVLYSPEPAFTDAARHSRTQGTAQLLVIINESGFPEVLEIVHPLGEGLDIQALGTVAKWRFQPATREGKPVAVMVAIEVNFQL